MTAGAAHRLLLIGGGHSHLEVLRRFARAPEPRIALTLVSPEARMAYTGMLPGTVAGHYAQDEAMIALAPLARRANAAFVQDGVRTIDLAARCAVLDGGTRVPFDSASLDVGSVPDPTLAGARDHAIGVKPVAAFLAAWEAAVTQARAGAALLLTVLGGGAGGVEIALALQHRLRQIAAADAASVALVSDRLNVPPAVHDRLAALLAQRGIALHLGQAVKRVEQGALVLQSGETVRATHIFQTTSAAAPAWLAASGLACDAHGFVRIGRHLASVSHPFVFAAGDCATQEHHPRPKAGVFAVRQGPVLAGNLRDAALGRRLASFVPQREALAIIATGDRRAIAVRGPFSVAGAWVWRWKDRIDRRFVARYRVP